MLPRPLLITEYIARHELSTILEELKSLEEKGLLGIKTVEARNPDYRRLRGNGHHKGEAEAIAFSLSVAFDGRPFFVSVNHHARKCAKDEGVPTGDLMDLIVDLVERHVLSREDAKEAIAVWNDRRQQLGRPKGFTTFEETYQRRLKKDP